MKKYISLLLFISGFLCSCQKTEIDELFKESPEDRVESQIEQLRERLLKSPYGWTGYFLYNNMKKENYINISFQKDGRAVIEYPGGDGKILRGETTYVLRYSQQVDLVFDTDSPLAMWVSQGGDFRFEFGKQEDGKIYFKSRNGRSEGEGMLELTQTKSAEAYPELIALQSKIVDKPTQSFFRVLKIDGTDASCNFNIVSLSLAWKEWLDADGVQREKYVLKITSDGFELEKPFTLGGVTIKRFIAQADGSFEVWSENAKVGSLNYGKAPFAYPNAVKNFLEEGGATEQTLWMIPDSYSVNFMAYISALIIKDPAFNRLQLQPVNNGFYIMTGKGNALYQMTNQFSEDGIGFQFTGRMNQFGEDYYDNAIDILSLFDNQKFIVFYRDKRYYLIQEKDPSIWFITTARGA